MKNTEKTTLKNELKAAGASSSELASLMHVAGALGDLKNAEEQVAAKDAQRAKPRIGFIVGFSSALGLAVGMLIVIGSQTALPGSVLYPVQKVSDSMAVSMDSSYRATVMMRRADEVQKLVNKHASSSEVLATLADYQRQAASYKSMSSNYEAFEYCKQSLEQAAQAAPASQKQAINNTLQSLNDV